jgi:hypothetical protein
LRIPRVRRIRLKTLRRIATTVLAAGVCVALLPDFATNARSAWNNFIAVTGMTAEERAAFFRPHAGEAILPLPAQAAIAMLRAEAARSFAMTASWIADPEIHQRTVEGAFPIRVSSTAPLLVGWAADFPPACRQIRRFEKQPGFPDAVVLGACD